MSLKPRVLVLVVVALSLPAWAARVEAAPSGGGIRLAAETWAAGFDVGFADPLSEDDLDLEPFGDGYIEYFFAANLSARGMLGLYSFDLPDSPGEGRGDLELLVVTGNVSYYWNEGSVHPFVTGGIGFYDYDQERGDEDLEIGFNAGGGVAFDLTGNFALKVEGIFHGTTAEGLDAFFTGTAGGRWHW